MANTGIATSATYNQDNKLDNVNSTNPKGASSEKKQDESFVCEICDLSFTNKFIMDAHLAGKRHQKALKSKCLGGLVKDCSNQDQNPADATIITEFYCSDCCTYANSANQLEMHMKSNKHNLKVAKNKGLDSTQAGVASGQKKKASENNSGATPAKKVKSDGPPEVFKCAICNVDMNSRAQYEQHIMSNKHKNKVSPKAPLQKKSGSSTKRKAAAYMAKKRSARFGIGYTQPLSSSFVSGGSYVNNSNSNSLLHGRNKHYNNTGLMKHFNKQTDYNSLINNAPGNKFNGENFRGGYGNSNPGVFNQGNYMSNYNSPKKNFYGDGYSHNFSMNNQLPSSNPYNFSMPYNNGANQGALKTSFSMW